MLEEDGMCSSVKEHKAAMLSMALFSLRENSDNVGKEQHHWKVEAKYTASKKPTAKLTQSILGKSLRVASTTPKKKKKKSHAIECLLEQTLD